MPTPTLVSRTITLAGVGTSSGGGGGSNAGMFGFFTITPSGGLAQIDIAALGAGTTCFCFRLVLNATAVSIPNPVWTGGSIVAGMKIWLYLEQDATGNRDVPGFQTGSTGSFTSDLTTQQIDGTPSTRTAIQLMYHGTRWAMDFSPIGTGMPLT